MPPRAYVFIFFFWSLLTILTPALVFLSENSKPPPPFQPTHGENPRILTRKVVGFTRKYHMLKVLAQETNAPSAIPTTPVTAPTPSLAPAAAAVPVRRFMAGAGKVILTTLRGLKQAPRP